MSYGRLHRGRPKWSIAGPNALGIFRRSGNGLPLEVDFTAFRE